MDSIILFSYRRCPFAIRVRMVLEEKGIPYFRKEEDLSNLSRELLTLHPEGRVPLLIHHIGDRKEIIYQSTVITEYLDEAFPMIPLMPNSSIERAKTRLWTYWCDNVFKPDLDLYKYEFATMDKEKKRELTVRLGKLLDSWNSALQSHPYLMGEKMTLADIHLFPFARQFLAIKPSFVGIERLSHLNQWLNQMISRPSFERVMAK